MLIGTLQNHAFVVHGHAPPFDAALDMQALDGMDGFRIVGELPGDRCGETIAEVGDINGDGIDDIGIGAQYADPNGTNSGQVYILFGSASVRSAQLQLGDLSETDGFVFEGTASDDYCGFNISRAGELNHDDGADLLLSCHGASALGAYRGAVYAIYGTSASIFVDGLE